MSHQISKSNLSGVHTKELAGSYGERDNKELQIAITIQDDGSANSCFQVISHRRLVESFVNLKDAIDCYNGI